MLLVMNSLNYFCFLDISAILILIYLTSAWEWSVMSDVQPLLTQLRDLVILEIPAGANTGIEAAQHSKVQKFSLGV